MATGEQQQQQQQQPFPPPFKDSDITDCPRCDNLCLGPTILPCGHVLCRACIREVLRVTSARCLQCEHPIRQPNQRNVRIVEMIQHLPVDPILESMVFKRLRERGDIPCRDCPKKTSTNAVKVCLDCREFFCEGCSSSHLKTKRGKEHVVKQIPTEDSFAANSAISCPACTQSGSTDKHDEHVKQNMPEWAKRQVELMQQKRRETEQVHATLEAIISLSKQLLARTQQQTDVLGDYVQRLDNSEVREGSTPGSYVVAMDKGNGERGEMTIDELETHMAEVRARNRCPSMDTLKRIFRGGEEEN